MPLAPVEITLAIVLEVHGLNNHWNETNIVVSNLGITDFGPNLKY